MTSGAIDLTTSEIQGYQDDGFIILRDLIPAALLTRLRAMAEDGRAEAHERYGVQAQRTPPMAECGIDIAPFMELHALPRLTRAVEQLFGAGYHPGGMPGKPSFSVLLNPAERPWATMWHRDWRDNIPGLDIAAWYEKRDDLRYFNQVNCALYEDSCTWVVPGSHNREDTAAEQARFPERPISRPPVPADATPEQLELDCRAYCESMPGALQVFLNAGDYMIYRNALWHLGNYLPYKRRATIHTSIMTEAFAAWHAAPPRRADGKSEMMNPYTDLKTA